MKELDELITYIENDLIGENKDIEIIDQAIKKYAELYHKKQLELYGVSKLRGQLFAFEKWQQTQFALPDEPLKVVDMYLNSK